MLLSHHRNMSSTLINILKSPPRSPTSFLIGHTALKQTVLPSFSIKTRGRKSVAIQHSVNKMTVVIQADTEPQTTCGVRDALPSLSVSGNSSACQTGAYRAYQHATDHSAVVDICKDVYGGTLKLITYQSVHCCPNIAHFCS